MEDHRAKKVLAACPRAAKLAKELKGEVDVNDKDAPWDTARRNCSIDLEKLVAMTGFDEKAVEEIVNRLNLLRLVYPNADLTDVAAGLIRAEVIARLAKQ